MHARRTAAFLALLVAGGLVITASLARRAGGRSARNRPAGTATPTDGTGATLAGRKIGGGRGGPRAMRDPDRDAEALPVDAPFYVADEDGLAIRGAEVRVASTSFSTDAKGRVQLKIPSGIGTYVIVEKDGYERWTGSIDPLAPETRIRLAKDRRSPLALRFSGAEVADGIEVHAWLESLEDDGTSFECLAPSKGRGIAFEPRVAPGTYVVAASAGGLLSGPAEIRVREGVAAEVVLEMAFSRTIRGAVRDLRGASVGAGHASWRQRPAGSRGQGLVTHFGDDGRFVLDGVPAGRVDVDATAKDFTVGHATVDSKQDDVVLVLRAFGTVEGTLDAPDDGGVANLRVVAVPAGEGAPLGSEAHEVPVHEGGDFDLWLPEGAWRLRAGNGVAFGPIAVVEVPPAGGVTARLSPPARGLSIAGRVVTETGEPGAASIQIARQDEAGPVEPSNVVVKTDERGRFEARRLPPGRYTVIASSDGRPGGWRANIEAGTMDVRIALTDGVPYDVGLSGGTRPLVSDRRLVFYSAADSIPVDLPDVSEEGEVRSKSLPPGRYLVSFAAGPWVAESAEAGTLSAGTDEIHSLRLVLSRGATVSGVVRDAKGSPRAGVGVEARRLRLAWDKATTTDESGAFQFVGLLPGTWRLVVRDAEGVVTHEAKVEVDGGGASSVDLLPAAR